MRNKAVYIAVAVLAAGALAQLVPNPPFISATGTAYDAQILTGFNAVQLAVKARTSNDNKYATVGTQANNSGPVSSTPFSLGVPAGGGVVGSNSAPALGGVAPVGPSILDKVGMAMVAPVQ
jgi:hypothetical protein